MLETTAHTNNDNIAVTILTVRRGSKLGNKMPAYIGYQFEGSGFDILVDFVIVCFAFAQCGVCVVGHNCVVVLRLGRRYSYLLRNGNDGESFY